MKLPKEMSENLFELDTQQESLSELKYEGIEAHAFREFTFKENSKLTSRQMNEMAARLYLVEERAKECKFDWRSQIIGRSNHQNDTSERTLIQKPMESKIVDEVVRLSIQLNGFAAEDAEGNYIIHFSGHRVSLQPENQEDSPDESTPLEVLARMEQTLPPLLKNLRWVDLLIRSCHFNTQFVYVIAAVVSGVICMTMQRTLAVDQLLVPIFFLTFWVAAIPVCNLIESQVSRKYIQVEPFSLIVRRGWFEQRIPIEPLLLNEKIDYQGLIWKCWDMDLSNITTIKLKHGQYSPIFAICWLFSILIFAAAVFGR